MIDMRSGKSEKRLVAEQLCVLYHEAIRNETSRVLSREKKRGLHVRKLDDLDSSARRAFLSAAGFCVENDVDVREYVAAQFSAWRDASAFHGRVMWASPQQMATLAAQVRYFQYKARAATRSARVTVVEEQAAESRWFVEERRLRGLARMQRRDPVDVLTEQPEQFSREFLRRKGVWDVVRDLWEERKQP